MWMQTEASIWANADATVFRLLMDGGRTERRLLAAGRTIDAAHRLVASVRKIRDAADAREHAAAAREVEREFGPSWGHPVRVRVAHAPTPNQRAEPGARRRLASTTPRRAIRSYEAPLIDARGRVALTFRVRYVGLKSKKWRPGLASDHVIYILREEAQEIGETALQVSSILSNMGDSAEEIAACWRALEAMEEGYRTNAIVQYRIIWNLPHNLDVDERRELVEEFCERTFGRLGLPWAAAVHKPDGRGDQRNYHAHVLFSTRPCEHVGDHEWAIAQEKVNGLTDPAGLKRLRALAAGHMNLACRDAGLAVRFTHQSYDEREIDAERQEHVGPERMAAHERGEEVAVITRNARIVASNEAAAARDAVERELALSARLAGLLEQSMDIAAKRRRLGTGLAAIRSIAKRARSLSTVRPKAPLISRATVARMAERARAVQEALAGRPAPALVVQRRAPVTRIGALAQTLGGGDPAAKDRRSVLSATRARLEEVQRRIADRSVALDAARQLRAESLLLDAPLPPYQVRDGKLFLDLSAMSGDDAALVRSMSPDVLRAALRARRYQDSELEAAATRDSARAAEAAQVAAERRRQQVNAACRILRETRKRPYRWEGTRLIGDLSVLGNADRALISTIGLGDADLAQTLVERAKRDRADDELARVAMAAEHQRTHHALNRLFEAFERERHWLRQESDRWIVPPPLLARVGLTSAELADGAVQLRLKGIAERDSAELAQITDHLRAAPDDLRLHEDGSWAFAPGAPPSIRAVIDNWRQDPTMQAALQSAARVAAAHPEDDAKPDRVSWRQARHAREQAMADGDAAERLDGPGLEQPGQRIARPGAEQPVPRQPFPRPPGMGFGG